MDITIKQQIAQAVKEFMDTHGIKQSDIARKSGVRQEYLTNILKKDSDFTYDAGKNGTGFIPVRHFNKLAEFIGFQIQKQYWQLQPTEQTANILATLKDAKEYGYTNVIIGETGCGKSFTCKLFAKKNPIDVFIITIGSSDNIGDMLDKVMDAINLRITSRTKSKKIREIIKKLRYLKDTGHSPMIIFDEAEYMKQPALCSMKELYDNLVNHCSIILVGTDQLVRNIEVMKKRNKPGIPQLYRRIKFGIRQLPSVDRSFALFLQDIEDIKVRNFLTKVCENYGELHDVLVPVLREADRLNEQLTIELIRKALNLPESL
ncbi:ATP-binding protein [Aquimarina algiphila]|uniref:ATP-binding protein n=1 Tax=Aquimarina algiphila TaxID=2047982 RepID=UPI00232B3417|nr:ATP-binding protein [Aquimarina algiphila]